MKNILKNLLLILLVLIFTGVIFTTCEPKPDPYPVTTVLSNPKAVVRFKISHNIRNDCEIKVTINSNEKIFMNDGVGWSEDLGNKPFPNNEIVMDITELYSYLSNNTVTIAITDSGTTGGTIQSVKLYIWDAASLYDDGTNPDHTYSDTSPRTLNSGTSESYQFNVGTVSSSAPMMVRYSEYNDSLKIKTAKPTSEQITKLKARMGTYQEGVNYNKIYHGKYGTGLQPPTEEEWKSFANSSSYIISVEATSKGTGQDLVDWTTSKYFPPIGNQGMKGSCASFNATYYAQTFYMARNNNWDLSGTKWYWSGNTTTYEDYPGAPDSNQDKIMSPQFVYHLVNYGVDTGSSLWGNGMVLSKLGTSTWETTPYDDNEVTWWDTNGYCGTYITDPVCGTDVYAWSGVEGFEEAPKFRGYGNNAETGSPLSWMEITSDGAYDYAVTLLDEGYILTTQIDANYYANFSAYDVWDEAAVPSSWSINHANTVVGFNKKFDPSNPFGTSGTGQALLIANSWGEWSDENVEDGKYWITKEAAIKVSLFCVIWADNPNKP